MFNCKDTIERPFPKVTTLPVSEVNATGATFIGTVENKTSEVEDYGFVWYRESQQPFLIPPRNAGRISLINRPISNRFETRVEAGLANNALYYVRAFVKSNGITVYGEEVVFKAEGSKEIANLTASPSVVVPGDTMTISGEQLGGFDVSQYQLEWGGPTFYPISVAQNELKVIVPFSISIFQNITLTLPTGKAYSINAPEIIQPEIVSVTPDAIGIGDTVTIRGSGFSRILNWNEITLNGVDNNRILSGSSDKLIFISEGYQLFWPPVLTVKNGIRESEDFLAKRKPPEIIDFFPKQGYTGDTVTIIGNHFPIWDDPSLQFVHIGNQVVYQAMRINSHEIKFIVPDFEKADEGYSGHITIPGPSGVVASEKQFTYFQKDWKKLALLPGDIKEQPRGFVLNDEVYYFNFYRQREIFKFNLDTEQWIQSGINWPEEYANNPSSSIRGNIGLGDKWFVLFQTDPFLDMNAYDCWLYFSRENKWEKVQTLIFENQDFLPLQDQLTLFALENKIYFLPLRYNDATRYLDLMTKEWVTIKNYHDPVQQPFSFVKPFSGTSLGKFGYAYVISSNESVFLQYNSSTDSWKKLKKHQGEGRFDVAFSFADKVYFASPFQGNYRFMEYTPGSNIFREIKVSTPPTQTSLNLGNQFFPLKDKVYVAQGEHLYEWIPRN